MSKGRVIGAAALRNKAIPLLRWPVSGFGGIGSIRYLYQGRIVTVRSKLDNRSYARAMKRPWIIGAIFLLLALPALAQVRGVPASVTSMAPWRSFNPGPPASVTSLGPFGFSDPCSSQGITPLIPAAMGCTSTQFTTGSFFPDPRDRGRVNLRPRHRHAAWYPFYVPYAYPVAVPVEEQEVEQEPAAPTIFEHRPPAAPSPYGAVSDSARYGTHYLDSREHPPAATPAPEPSASPTAAAPEVRDQTPVLLVYRDGQEEEIRNYAIVGQMLYDLGTFVAHKIPLALLDLKATVKANDERGVEFSLPASVKLD